MNKKLKIFCCIIGIILVILIAVFIFTRLWPAFGAKPSDTDKKDYVSRASNFDGEHFYNEHEFKVMESVLDGADDGVISNKGTIPQEILKAVKPSFNNLLSENDVTITWFGHSTLLIQMHNLNILFDPLFSDTTSPVDFIGNKRFSEVPADISQLPDIDVAILSHDHYDHLDYKSIKGLNDKVKQYVVPLGIEKDLERWGVSEEKIKNISWWEEFEINGLTIGCTPARHYSGRNIDDRFSSLWASWVLKDENHLIYESGDTGFDTHFKEIHDRYGDFDFALMDGAQYNLHWPSVHMTPEESYEAIKILGAKYAMPIHWVAFRLASHPWDDSVQRLVKAADSDSSKIIIATPRIGETINLKDISDYQNRWYESIF